MSGRLANGRSFSRRRSDLSEAAPTYARDGVRARKKTHLSTHEQARFVQPCRVGPTRNTTVAIAKGAPARLDKVAVILIVVSPVPSCPRLFSPQQATNPPPIRASHVCPDPVATPMAPVIRARSAH